MFLAWPAQAATPFRVCAEPDNLPLSRQLTHSGADIDLAALLAKDLGRPLEIKWVSQRDPSFFRSTIGAGACDAIMEVPSDFNRLTTTTPLYRTGFFFVTRKKDGLKLRSFDDAALRNLKIGLPTTGMGDTPPAIALTRRGLAAQLHSYSIFQPHDMVDAVAKGDIDVAIVWGPFAGWFAAQEKTPLSIAATPEKDGTIPLSFNVSIGVRKGNDGLKNRLDAALARNQTAIVQILRHWHIPTEEK